MGGGNFITQSYPTNFHRFWTKKMLAPGEDISEFMEVTAAEKSALEASDAAWAAPDPTLVERWNFAWRAKGTSGHVFGRYNRETGFFEGNGKVDITPSQALLILDAGRLNDRVTEICERQFIYGLPTVLPIYVRGSLRGIAEVCKIDTIRIVDYYIINNDKDPDTTPISITNTRDFCYQSPVKHVLGILNVANDSASQHLYNCHGTFETIWLKNIFKGVDLRLSPNLRLDCLLYMIENALETTGQILSVHADVYAKLMGDETNAAYNSLTEEEKAQWAALMPLATEKNIQFATT